MVLVVVPMAGTGARYRRAGHLQPKPLIDVDGLPMIERVVAMFPGQERFLFIVNRDHARSSPLLSVLARVAPQALVRIIEPHSDGPIETLLRAEADIPDEEAVVVNYCDFGATWSYADFLSWWKQGGFAAAMTAYRGFHPHSLGPTLYAYMQNEGERVTAIKEKGHFTNDRMSELASSGLYAFSSGALLKRAAHDLVAAATRVNGEFYVSTAVGSLIDAGMSVGVMELAHFFQWGTPEDLADYVGWARALREADAFRARVAGCASSAALVVPMAGKGQRFRDRGFDEPKPFIDVAGAPMAAQVLACLPRATDTRLATTALIAGHPLMASLAMRSPPQTRVCTLAAETAGQAATVRAVIDDIDGQRPVLVASCDTGASYDLKRWTALCSSGDDDLIVWSARGHLPALWRPQQYGWMDADDDGRVRAVRVKVPLDTRPLAEQDTILGTFFFSSQALLVRELDALIRDDERVNGELYLDTVARRMVERGARVRVFRVDKWLPWGTPDELFTFRYWNDVFRQGRSWPSSTLPTSGSTHG